MKKEDWLAGADDPSLAPDKSTEAKRRKDERLAALGLREQPSGDRCMHCGRTTELNEYGLCESCFDR